MDINKWLDETVEAEGPLKGTETTTSNFFNRPEQPRRVFRVKRARQHTTSDSSILAPQPHSRTAPLKAPELSAEHDTNASACSETPGPSHDSSAESDSSSHCYARRPRHKTRLERYEPKRSKESKKHVHPSRKDKSKKSTSRSRNKKRRKTDSAAGQTFHAKNVSRDRLTLKPKEQLGLFNKGKTSTAVRGRGLPDLVFSEMRFLQKEQPSPEPNIQQVAPKKKRKSDHAQTKEGEISAYFTTTRPALIEKDGNAPSQPVLTVPDMDTRNRGYKQTQSRKSTEVVATTEGPYLGFGSRGPRHESTSYVSWSESVREPEVTFPRPEQPSSSHLEHAKSLRPDWMRHATSNAQHARANQTTPHADNRASNSSNERFRISSVVDPPPRISRSHSYPQRSSSPRKVNLIDRAAKVRGTESITSPSTLPPHVLNESPLPEAGHNATAQGRETSHAAAANALWQPNHTTRIDTTFTDGGQQSSSDLENIIRHCNHSVLDRDLTAEQPDGLFMTSDLNTNDQSNAGVGRVPVAQHEELRRPTVRFSHVEVPFSNEVLIYSGPSFYERQAREQRAASLCQEDIVDMDESYLSGQDLMYAPDTQMYNEQDWDDGRELLYDEGEMLEGFDGSERAQFPEDRVQKLPSDDGVVARGFWRPNKLY